MSAEHITSGSIPQKKDSLRILCVKDLGPSAGSHGTGEEYIGSGKQPKRSSTVRILLVKDVNNGFN